MTYGNPVVIRQLPEHLTAKYSKGFFQELDSLFDEDRPYIVLDFSIVSRMDSTGVDLLLHAMEEALKRNGDVKLAAVPADVAVVMEMMGIRHLFEIFENSADAMESFHHSSLFVLQSAQPAAYQTMGERAA